MFSLKTPGGQKSFCSELCFTQCRRANFKRNKTCDWCRHIRHTVNYVDFQDGEHQLQFCRQVFFLVVQGEGKCKKWSWFLSLRRLALISSSQTGGTSSSSITSFLVKVRPQAKQFLGPKSGIPKGCFWGQNHSLRSKTVSLITFLEFRYIS